MKFKNWQRIYSTLNWLSWPPLLSMAFVAIVAYDGYTPPYSWVEWSMGVFLFTGLFATILCTIIKGFIDLAAKENNLIVKYFGKPESKFKTYYFYNTGANRRFHHKARILNEIKKFRELKFTPKGLFINTHWFFLLDAKEQLFLWEDVKKVVFGPNEITIKFHNSNKIENKANPNNPLLVGNSYYVINKTDFYCYILNDIVFIKLIKTFYEGEIEEASDLK
ncbi:MAG: hypothetical protein FWE36_02540 [Erysipelotrichales bacterium]|nr:hypothetical protein [Erysipelotrichales bacterium]